MAGGHSIQANKVWRYFSRHHAYRAAAPQCCRSSSRGRARVRNYCVLSAAPHRRNTEDWVVVQSHKPGRKAGAGARARNRHGKQDVRNSYSLASHLARKGKESRMQAAAHSRNQSRQAALQRMRHEHAPIVVQMVSLADNMNEQSLWCVPMILPEDVVQHLTNRIETE